jgi:murein DD-endopeptidase MepM/ murein hydrolase activator NlpD
VTSENSSAETPAISPADIEPKPIQKTPSELLNCALLDGESFLVFSPHFSRKSVVDGKATKTSSSSQASPGNAKDDFQWQWPTRGRTIRNDSGGSGSFNAPRASGRGHQGIDIVAAVGEPVLAARAGTIVDPAWEGSYGKVVDLQHAGGYLSRYAHLSSFSYSHGSYVEKGARIAAAGRTGNASGYGITPHLHFEIRRGGRLLNPKSVLP